MLTNNAATTNDNLRVVIEVANCDLKLRTVVSTQTCVA